MNVTRGQLAERVREGIVLLNEKSPGWRNAIDLETFDIKSFSHCVIGQVYSVNDEGDYDAEYRCALEKVGIMEFEAWEYGFGTDWTEDNSNEVWIALQELWLDELNK
jgi:hypothetical protein